MVYIKTVILTLVFLLGFCQLRAQTPPIHAGSSSIQDVLTKVTKGAAHNIAHFKRGNREMVIYGLRMPTGLVYYDTVVVLCKGDEDVWYQLAVYTQVVEGFSCVEEKESIVVKVSGENYLQIYWRSIPGFEPENS